MPADGESQEKWTRVKPKSRFRKGPRNDSTKASLSQPSSTETQSTKSAAEIQAEYETFKARWQESEAFTRLKDLVSANVQSCQSLRKAVCLGIGTFDPEHGGWDAKRRTYVQLLGFLTMVEELSERTDSPMRCIFQEPRFSPGDKEFIRGLGHEVVETPAAFEAVDEHTLLFAVHMYRPIYELALERTLSAAFVGTGWDTWDEVGSLKEGEFQCMRDMHESHRLFPFPQDGTHTTFSSTCLYWRPRTEEDPDADAGHDSPEQESTEQKATEQKIEASIEPAAATDSSSHIESTATADSPDEVSSTATPR